MLIFLFTKLVFYFFIVILFFLDFVKTTAMTRVFYVAHASLSTKQIFLVFINF